jgi:biopolymer transport protein ExbD
LKLKKFDSINIVPFIDIILILLVAILVTATFINNRHLSVELPSATSATNIKQNLKNITITIVKNGDIFIDKKPISKDALLNTLALLNKANPIVINCDKNSKFKNFLYLLDTLKSNNFTNIAIVTKDE